MTVSEYIKAKALDLLGLVSNTTNPNSRAEDLMFVNDISEIRKERLKEYNIWYAGDCDELLNYYTRAMNIDYNHDPIYNRNKKSYFWSVASVESDIKRTHTGIPRAIIDTLVNIVAIPKITTPKESDQALLDKILKANRFDHLLVQQARPYTLVEGWGAYRIDWDKSLSDYPIIRYYRAENVDFFYKSNTLCAIVYKDYFSNAEKQSYILFETRRLGKNPKNKNETGLIIEKDLFRLTEANMLIKEELKNIPQLRDIKPIFFIKNYKGFLGAPSIYFEDPKEEMYGRSIFTGKLDYFDDADQCASQAANAVRLSTPTQVFNTQFLERDEETGMPIMPKSYDRKYVAIRGMTSADGDPGKVKPVEVIQPQIDFTQYSNQSKEIFVNILQGMMSPASFGIDVSIKDNAASQREKEKITIYTRNGLISEEERDVEILCSDLLFSYYLMRAKDGEEISTPSHYDISVSYNEFADTSFEHKLDVVGNAYQGGILSPESAVEMLYPTDEEKQARELEFIKGQKEQEQQAEQAMMEAQMQAANNPQMPPMSEEEMAEIGREQGGLNNNPVDQARMKPETVETEPSGDDTLNTRKAS